MTFTHTFKSGRACTLSLELSPPSLTVSPDLMPMADRKEAQAWIAGTLQQIRREGLLSDDQLLELVMNAMIAAAA